MGRNHQLVQIEIFFCMWHCQHDASKGNFWQLSFIIWIWFPNLFYFMEQIAQDECSVTKYRGRVLAPILSKTVGAEAPTAPILTRTLLQWLFSLCCMLWCYSTCSLTCIGHCKWWKGEKNMFLVIPNLELQGAQSNKYLRVDFGLFVSPLLANDLENRLY